MPHIGAGFGDLGGSVLPVMLQPSIDLGIANRAALSRV
jgi:hypothetical protein